MTPLPEPSPSAWTASSREPALRRILLATDLAPTTDLATDWAFALARTNDAALLGVSVIDPRELRVGGGRSPKRVDQVRDGRERAAHLLVERGRRIGVPVTFLVWTGDPGGRSSRRPRPRRSTRSSSAHMDGGPSAAS